MEEARIPSLSSFFPTWNPGKSRSIEKRRDAFIAQRGIHGGEQEKEARFGRVGDPQLAPGEPVAIAIFNRARGQSERVRAGAGFGKRITRHRVFRRARQPAALLFVIAPAQDRVVEQRVLNIHDHRRRRIHAGQFLDRQNGLEERAALAAEFLGDFDGHQAQLEEFLQQVLAKDARIVHGAHVRGQAFARKTAHGSLEQSFLFAQQAEWRHKIGRCHYNDEGYKDAAHPQHDLPLWIPRRRRSVYGQSTPAPAPKAAHKAPTPADWAALGKLPDFTGVWEVHSAAVAVAALPERPVLPPLPAAPQAVGEPWPPRPRSLPNTRPKQRDGERGSNKDRRTIQSANCLPPGMPAIMSQPYPIEVLMTPGLVTIVIEAYTQVRHIYTDGRPHARRSRSELRRHLDRPLGRRYAGGGIHGIRTGSARHQFSVQRKDEDRRALQADRSGHFERRDHDCGSAGA